MRPLDMVPWTRGPLPLICFGRVTKPCWYILHPIFCPHMKYVFFQHKSLHYDIVLHCTLHCTPLMRDSAVFIATPLNLSVQTIR